jgi:redox-sensitive bicupin YhaK (pirin superfamily)
MDDIVIDPEFFDCSVPAGGTYDHTVDPAYTAFIYVIGGEGRTEGTHIDNGTLVLYEAGETLAVQAGGESVRFLLLTGKPLREPVAWQGPIVMNTRAELDTAFREYREGTFIKAGPPPTSRES